MIIRVHNVDTGYLFIHSGLTQAEVNDTITAISQNNKSEYRIIITVKP